MKPARKKAFSTTTAKKTVLMLSVKGDTFAQEGFAIARREALRRRWELFSAEVFRDAGGTMRLLRASRGADSVADLMALLKPDGLVVWGTASSVPEVRRAADAGLPVVFVNRNRKDDASGHLGGVCVCCDPTSIATVASRVLFFSVACDDFAFVPYPGELSWSRERGDAFARCVAVAGKRLHRFARPHADIPGASEELERWLEALPKPCGVFAANDSVGEEVLGACVRLGIAVPDEIAVIGVDNFVHICESTTPTLSSIATDSAEECRVAVELLDKWMASPRRPPRSRVVSVRGAVLRASTPHARDRRVARALEFIRLHACEEKFGPRDIVPVMGVSRTLCDKLFRRACGHTILDEIHAVRLSRAKELLADGIAPDAVGARCGYASHDDFRRVFRTRLGTTIKSWLNHSAV